MVRRDLWINSNSIGIMIKEESIVNHIQESIHFILEQISNGEMKAEIIEGKNS